MKNSILISPFYAGNDFLNINAKCTSALERAFGEYLVFRNARTALLSILKSLDLDKNDIVSVVTTSQNRYLSSCVTNEIEKVCKWDRVISDASKAILVVHEFGYLYEDIDSLHKYNIPIIEDCAYSFFPFFTNKVQIKGDFAFFSLPKAFDIENGGLLISRNPLKDNLLQEPDFNLNRINNQLNESHIRWIIERRLHNYAYLCRELSKLGCREMFSLKDNDIPGVFVFAFPPDSEIDKAQFKINMNIKGIESTVYYGRDAYYIPVHQHLTDSDLDYMIQSINDLL